MTPSIVAASGAGQVVLTVTMVNKSSSGTGQIDMPHPSDSILLNTSNSPPTIAPATLTRQQGSPAGAAVTVATVTDLDTPRGSLIVNVDSAPAGITIGPPSNSLGTIAATVAAACTAGVGPNAAALKVTDAGGLFATGTLTVNVTPNTAPVLGTYAATTVPLNGGTVVIPSAAPGDNGSVNVLSATASAGFTGTLSVDLAGNVTVSNAAPAGTYTIIVTATDNCAVSATNNFSVNVTTPLVGPPTDKDQCKDGGWKTFNNPSFKNQGACVSFVESKGKKK